MKAYFSDFLKKFDYPEEAVTDLIASFDNIAKSKESYDLMKEIVDTYENDCNCDYDAIMKKCDSIATISGTHHYAVKLIAFILMSKPLLEKYYKNAGIGYDIWYDSILDLKYKALECKAVKNIWGSFVAGWFIGFYNMNRFTFGRLQFEICKFGKQYSEGDKTLNEDSKVINMHIPRSLKPLLHEECLKSYARAVEFYKSELGDTPPAFVCSSWLLYPENYNILPEKSNIRAFMNDFTILSVGDNAPGSYPDMWRLFDMDYTGDLNDYPEDSSLRRAYKKHLLAGGKTGSAHGVFFYPPKQH